MDRWALHTTTRGAARRIGREFRGTFEQAKNVAQMRANHMGVPVGVTLLSSHSGVMVEYGVATPDRQRGRPRPLPRGNPIKPHILKRLTHLRLHYGLHVAGGDRGTPVKSVAEAKALVRVRVKRSGANMHWNVLGWDPVEGKGYFVKQGLMLRDGTDEPSWERENPSKGFREAFKFHREWSGGMLPITKTAGDLARLERRARSDGLSLGWEYEHGEDAPWVAFLVDDDGKRLGPSLGGIDEGGYQSREYNRTLLAELAWEHYGGPTVKRRR